MIPKDNPRIEIPESIRRKMVEVARQFRKEPTPSEALLWRAVRGKKLAGIKFRRQQPIGPFVVDFYAPACRLIVEVDGPIHASQRAADEERQEILEMLGFHIIRFRATEVERDLPTVLGMLRNAIGDLQSVLPSPLDGEGSGVGQRDYE
jgi:very-short-patch-repair endonuclease